MNTKHHVSLKIAKQLAEAGIVIESEYVWCHGDLIPVINVILETAGSEIYPAPIATELLERLPAKIYSKADDAWLRIEKINNEYFSNYYSSDRDGDYAHYSYDEEPPYSKSIPDALALLLIRLTKDGLI